MKASSKNGKKVLESYFKPKIGLAEYETKEKSVTAYLLEDKKGRINLLVPGQPASGPMGKGYEPVIFALCREDKGGYHASYTNNDLLNALMDKKDLPVAKDDFLKEYDITPVEMGHEHWVSLLTGPDFLLSYPHEYLMSILTKKKKPIKG